MLESSADAGAMPRAFLRVGGMSVARQQVALALALDCERVICLAGGVNPDLIDLQHRVEAAGAKFHVVGGARALLGLITTVDEVIVLGDGLFASIREATALLGEGQGVLVQPIEQGLAAGFERIDLNHASAAAMRLPGRLIERIAELPADCDVASALQRIALQAGVRQRPIPAGTAGQLFWTLVRSEAEAHALEPLWVRQRTGEGGPLGPSRWLALLGVRSFGPALLHAGSGPGALGIAAGLTGLFGLGAGWLNWPILGLLLVALAWLLSETALLLGRIQGDQPKPGRGLGLLGGFGWALDAVIVALAGWASTPPGGIHLLERFFPAFMLVALLRILSRTFGARAAASLEDRALLAIGLVLALLSGAGTATIQLGAVLLAIAGIALPGAVSRLTRP